MSHLGQCYMNVMPSCYVASQSVSCECDAIMLCHISVYCHHVMSHLGVLPSCYVTSLCIVIMLCHISVYCHHVMSHLCVLPWEPLLKYENVVFNGEQIKESFV